MTTLPSEPPAPVATGWAATHWGTYRVSARDGEVVDVTPIPGDPDPSRIGENLRGALRSSSRVMRPAVRRGWLEHGPGPTDARGRDPFVEVGWDELVDLLAGEIARVRSTHGNEAIYGGSYGWGSAGRFHHTQSQVHRFLNVLGGCTRSRNTYSHAADEVVLPHLVGDREWFLRHLPRWSQILEHTRYVLAFGGLPRRSVQVSPGGVGAHQNAGWQDRCAEAGVQFTAVSPTRADTAPVLVADWLAVRPATDVALMLALCHVLLTDGTYDADFLQRGCVGSEVIFAYLLGDTDGTAKTPEWAAEICDVPADAIRRTARRLVSTRSLVSVTWSLQRQHHGEMAYWAAVTLAAMSGSMGRPGGGFVPGLSSMHSAWVGPRVSMAAALPQGHNPVGYSIPVARIADLLLQPGAEYDYDGTRARYPDIRLRLLGRRQRVPPPPGPESAASGVGETGHHCGPRAALDGHRQTRRHRRSRRHLAGT